MNRRLRQAAAVVALAALSGAASFASAASPPYVRLDGTVGALLQGARGCGPGDPTPIFTARADLGSAGSYRYSPAWVVPFYFDDEGEFNLLYNSDAVLEVSPYFHAPRTPSEITLSTTGLASWLAAFGRLPDHSQLALRVAAYDAGGAPVSMSRITWDCSSGQILSVEHRGNAADAVPDLALTLVEFYHASFDHYFMSADAAEIAALDTGRIAGWMRTGRTLAAWASAAEGVGPVCRFYLPPANGDSHFFSASPQECGAVAVAFPSFIKETSSAFYAGLPDPVTGRCAADAVPVYRLWNNRADSNHRYTSDRAVKSAMVARGYIAEGYGPEAVSLCARP